MVLFVSLVKEFEIYWHIPTWYSICYDAIQKSQRDSKISKPIPVPPL